MKMRQSNSAQFCNSAGKRRQRSIVICSLAIHDSQGLSARVFTGEDHALLWLADYAEGPDDAERRELHKLAQQPDKLLFWRFLREATPPYVQYRLDFHTLRLRATQ
jgi:hypothetical protein